MGVYRDRSDGKWVAAKMHKGRRLQQKFTTKRAADLKYSQFVREMELTDSLGQDKVDPITFDEFSVLYLDWSKIHKAESTFYRDMFTVIKHLVPHFRQTSLTDVSLRMIEDYKSVRVKKVAPRTVNTEMVTLKAMLNRAIEWGYLQKSPAVKVRKLRITRRPKKILSIDQINEFYRACRTSRTRCLLPFVVTGMNTGMRKGELFNLEWADVDLEARSISIKNKKDWSPKTDAGIRFIPMNDLLHETLAQVHQSHPSSPYVFYNSDGTRFHDIRGSFNNALDRAGVPRITIHDMRHIYLTYLSQKVEIPVAQSVAGHEDQETTSRYITALPDHVSAVVRAVQIGERSWVD